MISFVILHYLVTEETIHCTDSILNHMKDDFNVIIVDNASPNDSYAKLTEYYQHCKKVTVITNTGNSGYAAGINFGYRFACDHYQPDFIVTMNNDMEIKQSDFAEKLAEIFNRTHFYVLGPDIYSTSALRHQNPEKRCMLSLADVDHEIAFIKEKQTQQLRLRLKGFLKQSRIIESWYYKLKRRLTKEQKVTEERIGETLHGSCYVFSRLFINARSYALFPKTKFYCEAQVLDYECKRDGMKQLYAPELVVYHHEDVATNQVAGSYVAKMNKKFERMLDSLQIFKRLILQDERKQGS